MANAANITRQIKSIMAEYDVVAEVHTRYCLHRSETDRRAGWHSIIELPAERAHDRLAAKGALLCSDIPEIDVKDTSEFFMSAWQPA